MGGSSIHVVCNDSFQCTSSYKPCPFCHENQPGLPDFSACNIEQYGEAWIQGYVMGTGSIIGQHRRMTERRGHCTIVYTVHSGNHRVRVLQPQACNHV